MLKPLSSKPAIFVSAILVILSLLLLSSCEEAYQEAKDNKVSKEDSPEAEDTLSPLDNEYEPIDDEIPVFKNEAMNRAIEQYTAVSVRLGIAAERGVESEVSALQKKEQEILNQIRDLRSLLTNEEQLALDQYLQSLGAEDVLHRH